MSGSFEEMTSRRPGQLRRHLRERGWCRHPRTQGAGRLARAPIRRPFDAEATLAMFAQVEELMRSGQVRAALGRAAAA